MSDQLPEDAIRALADYLLGYGAAVNAGRSDGGNAKLSEAAEWLYFTANSICAGGVLGCGGGRECTSDHK